MKNFILLLIAAFMLSGCVSSLFVQPEPVKQLAQVAAKQKQVDTPVSLPDLALQASRLSDDRSMRTILRELLDNGELLNKDVHARRFGDYEYTWEMWLVRERNTGDYHAAIIENGVLIDISPVDSLEGARGRFKPYGGWRDSK